MNPRSAYLFQILEKIGAPLLAAADSRTGGADTQAEATLVAELLTRAVQAGVELATAMDIRESGPESESVRLALTSLAGPLVGGHYQNTGRVPTDAEITKLVTALSATLTFADNFSPAAGNTARLSALNTDTPPVDDTQVMMQCLQSLTPLVQVIAAYPFGRPERKMVQDVTERLVRQAGTMALRLLPGTNNPSDLKQAELVLVRAMAPLYCAAHNSETRRVMALDENARNQAAQTSGGVMPLDTLWQDFDRQVAMLDILAQSLLTGLVSHSAQESVSVGRPAIPQEAAIVPPAMPSAAPVAPLAPPPPPPPAPPPEAPSGPFNPMAFFKPGAPKEDSGNGENT